MSLDRTCWLEHETNNGTECVYSSINAYRLAIALEDSNVKLQSYSDEYITQYQTDNEYPIYGQIDFLALQWIYLKDLLNQYKFPEKIQVSETLDVQPDFLPSMEEIYKELKIELNILSALLEKYPESKIVYLIEN